MTDHQSAAKKKVLVVWSEWSTTREYEPDKKVRIKFPVTALAWDVTKQVAEALDVELSALTYQKLDIEYIPSLPDEATFADLPNDMPLLALVSYSPSFISDAKQRIHKQRDVLSEVLEMMNLMQQQNDKKMEEMRKTINGQYDKKMEEMRTTMNETLNKKESQNNKKMEEMRKTINGQHDKRMEEMRKTMNDTLNKKEGQYNKKMEDMEQKHEEEIDSLKKDLKDAKQKTNELEQNLAELQASHDQLRRSISYLHLRRLLDQARDKAAYDIEKTTWDGLRKTYPDKQDLSQYIYSRLANSSTPLSDECINLLCFHSDIRNGGDVAAHSATKDEIILAIIELQVRKDREKLAMLFHYVFGEHLVV